MSLQTIGFNYGGLALNDAMDLKASAERIKVRLKRTADDIIEIGKELIIAKDKCGHGNFENWLQQEFEMTDRTAQNFINVAKKFGDKTETVSLLNATALYALSAPSMPEEVRTEVIQRLENGEKIDMAEINRLKKEKAEAQSQAIAAEEKYQRARRSVEVAQMAKDNAERSQRELENRFDHYVKQNAAEIAAKQIEEKQAEMQANLDAIVAQTEAQLSAEYQAKIDSQTDEISRLKNQLNNPTVTPEQLAELTKQITAAQYQLTALNSELADAHNQAQVNEAINQGYYNTFESIISGVSGAVASLEVAHENGLEHQPVALCPLNDRTRALLLKTVLTLKSTAQSLDYMIHANDGVVADDGVIDD